MRMIVYGLLLVAVLSLGIAASFGVFGSNSPTAINPPLATSSVTISTTTSTAIDAAASSTPVATTSTAKVPKKTASKPKPEVVAETSATKAEPLYTAPPLPFEQIDTLTRGPLVNIFCAPKSGTLRPVSGSGIIVDPRGVILTNAHVAQYVLLSESSKIDLTCSIRTGAPAVFTWKAEVLYMPPVWVAEHAKDINSSETTGTGEHDYAFLRITSLISGEPVTTPLPYLPLDTRESAASADYPVLLAGYPAEFVGGIVAQQNLYPVTTTSKVGQLLTFGSGTVDMFSVNGAIQAQRGSSGGPAINAWARVVGIITTTSAGNTTGERELHIMNTEYIARDFMEQNGGKSLRQLFESDVVQTAKNFRETVSPALIEQYIRVLTR